jgi:carboxymethylenebutenolidase
MSPKKLLAVVVGMILVGALLARAAEEAKLPAGATDAKARIGKSPRHGEYVDIAVEGGKPVKAYVVYPEVKDKAPVVMVISEIFGLSDWIKGVADQLAAEGFIAIAPDFVTGKGPNGGGTESFKTPDEVVQAIRSVKPDDVKKILDGTRAYAAKIPAATDKVGTVGFCWGGAQSFYYATMQPELKAAVVYYGTSPATETLEKVKAPVLGLYGGVDNRVNATIEPAQKKMKELGKSYDPHIFEGAGHGFLRQQDGQNGANMKATQEAWPLTIKFLKENLK